MGAYSTCLEPYDSSLRVVSDQLARVAKPIKRAGTIAADLANWWRCKLCRSGNSSAEPRGRAWSRRPF